jgi:NAD+ synthase
MALADNIAAWIRSIVHDAGAEGVVIGLSGGLDSAAAAAVSQRALPGKVLAALLPCESDPQDAEHARLVASTLGVETIELDLTDGFNALKSILPEAPPLVVANVKPRLRMIALYYLAASRSYLVCGASNRSELAVGYFTKHGDGAADLLPLGGLLKSQVRQLARDLGIPQRVVDKPPSAGLWPGQTDEDEIGMRYAQLDVALLALDRHDPSGVPAPIASRLRELARASAHKRARPPIFEPKRG